MIQYFSSRSPFLRLTQMLLLFHTFVNSQNLPCSICSKDLPEVSNPDTIVPVGSSPFLKDEITCADLQSNAVAGVYSVTQCILLRALATGLMCGCAPPSPTNVPTVLMTGFPSMAPVVAIVSTPETGNPTKSPTATTTERTTDTPTSTPNDSVMIEKSILLSLLSTMGEMNNVTQEVLEKACGMFLAQKLNLTDVTCTVTDQEWTLPADRNLRYLQTNETAPLATTISIEASSDEIDPETFSDMIAAAIQDNPQDFIDIIQEVASETLEAEDFFSTVEGLEVEALPRETDVPVSSPTTEPTGIPEEDNSDNSGNTLSGWAVYGIVVGVIGCLAAAICIYKNASKNDSVRTVPGSPVHWKPMPDDMENPAASNVRPGGYTRSSQPVEGDKTEVSFSQSLDEAPTVGISSSTDSSKVAPSVVPTKPVLREQNIYSTRTVLAPPGKLGLIIDVKPKGSVVIKTKPGSPLEGLLFPGDIIISINGTDTSQMRSSAIAAVMLETHESIRELIVIGEDISG